jgi:hypothetical protein
MPTEKVEAKENTEGQGRVPGGALCGALKKFPSRTKKTVLTSGHGGCINESGRERDSGGIALSRSAEDFGMQDWT